MMFELKQECEDEYDPFYFHYNRMDHSKVSSHDSHVMVM